jgi:hypothetical protein
MHLVIIEHFRSAFHGFHPVARAIIGLGVIALLVYLVIRVVEAGSSAPAKSKDKAEG